MDKHFFGNKEFKSQNGLHAGIQLQNVITATWVYLSLYDK